MGLSVPKQKHSSILQGIKPSNSLTSHGSARHYQGNVDTFLEPNKQPSGRQISRCSGSVASAGCYNNSQDNSLGSEERAAAALQGLCPGRGHNDSAYRTYTHNSGDKTQPTQINSVRMASQAGARMDRDSLEEALDDIYDQRILFLGRFELYSQVCVSGHLFPVSIQYHC